MPRMPPVHRQRQATARVHSVVTPDRQRWQSMYNTRAWRSARTDYLRANPLCAHCRQAGRVQRATVVDHVTPHRGDDRLFWDRSNWQPLCRQCHNVKTARTDGGFGNTKRGGAG